MVPVRSLQARCFVYGCSLDLMSAFVACTFAIKSGKFDNEGHHELCFMPNNFGAHHIRESEARGDVIGGDFCLLDFAISQRCLLKSNCLGMQKL